MKIVNKTSYNTQDLEKIFNECVKICNGVYVRKVTVIYNRNIWNKPLNYVGGYAFVGGTKIVIKLPETKDWISISPIGNLNTKAKLLARVMLHEQGHLLKVKHYYDMTIEHMYSDTIKQTFNDFDYPVNL